MGKENTQQLFFQHIKSNLPAHISLVDEVADLLNISNDSAYRRIRSEKSLDLNEIEKLCTHFKISVDQIFSLESDVTLFTDKAITSHQVDFEEYLQSIIDQLQFINSFDERKMYYTAKDVPVFHYFNYPEITAFKFYFWRRTILSYPEISKQKFVLDDLNESLHQKGKKILDLYNNMSSVELWNVESINSTVRQIEYSRESKFFADPMDVVRIYERLENLVDHIEEQAQIGCKFHLGSSPTDKSPTYELFFNEVFLGDNSILGVMGDAKIVFINHSVLNFLTTRDSRFCDYIHHSIENLMRRSTLISSVGERERNRFFDALHRKLAKKKQNALEEAS